MDFRGKTIAFLGDSITEGYNTSSSEARYDTLTVKALGAKSLNYGIGGTRIAHQHRASEKPRWDLNMCARADRMDRNADAVLVFGGTNDYGHGDAPFGAMEDTTPDTFCGAVEFLMNFLQERYRDRPVIFLTPAQRQGCAAPAEHPYKQSDARPLKDYAQVIREKAAAHAIAVLDVYSLLGIDFEDEGQRIEYTGNPEVVDGVHLNDKGHARLAGLLIPFLEGL